MEMTKYAQAIKHELELELAKLGSSLYEFEEALSNLNHGEGVFKVAKDTEDILSGYIGKGMSHVGSLPELALKSSLAGGAMAGFTLDEMDKSVGALNKSLENEREKINLVRRLTHNLKREHGLV
jgi:hypothetical protein